MPKPEKLPPKKVPRPGKPPKVPPTSSPPAPPVSPPPVVSPPMSPPPPPTAQLGSYGNASIDQWDDAFVTAVHAVKAKKGVYVNPLVMKGIMDVETGGDGSYPASRCRAKDSFDDVPACGPMQIKYQYHKLRCPECDFNTVPGQIELATHIIGDTMKARDGDEYDALTATYFPADDPGHSTQNQYVTRVKDLVAKMGGTTPAPKPEPEPTDVIDAIVGGAPYTDDYGFKAPTDLPYYAYFENHGGHPNQHTGIDVTGNIGQTLYSPISGTVVCAGTGIGAGAYGSSCAAFEYTLGPKTRSSGRFEILADDGKRSLIFGHVLRSVVPVGAKVQPGQKVAELGGENGPHVHVEARIWQGGQYTIVDPRQAFGGDGVIYAERIPIPQPDDFDVAWKVRAIKDGVPVLQRADLNAAPVRKPLAKGEDFDAVYVVIANDGSAWWVSSLGSRIPVEGTEAVGGPVIKVA